MSQPPGPKDLLATAARALRESVVAELSGAARHQALMIANALAIAGRQLDEAPLADAGENPPSLAAAIRAGAVDGRADVYDGILRRLRAQVSVSNPKALAREDIEDALR